LIENDVFFAQPTDPTVINGNVALLNANPVLHDPAVMDVLEAEGGVQPEGTAIVMNEVFVNVPAELLVKVKVSLLPVVPADITEGVVLTLTVPQPLPAAEEQLTTEMVG
jgi:hypothetical protein